MSYVHFEPPYIASFPLQIFQVGGKWLQRANCYITETSHQPSQPQVADESHHSDAHYSDAKSTGPISADRNGVKITTDIQCDSSTILLEDDQEGDRP